MRTVDEAVAAYEAGETWNDDDEVVELEIRRPLDKVIPVRLNAEQWTAVRTEAQELGIGPSTLIRMWVLEKLHGKRAGGTTAISRTPQRRPLSLRAAKAIQESPNSVDQNRTAKKSPRRSQADAASQKPERRGRVRRSDAG